MAQHNKPGSQSAKILVFSTNNIADPGIDLAGSSHIDYPTTVQVISLPCSSGVNPQWVLHALKSGFDGVFIAADGDDCSFLSDCTERTGKVVSASHKLLEENGIDKSRMRMAAICSVCSVAFVGLMTKFSKDLVAMNETVSPGS
ncbi:MAG: hydrogenase iron-sulfur subunit [Rubrobacteridae bacterium]|nr:hydrogenase iron-sulfur subunit [Rubrobacteridae bacterium]